MNVSIYRRKGFLRWCEWSDLSAPNDMHMNHMMPLESLAARIRGEYCEMPGLRLTFAQACRLWQLDASTCEALLEALVREAFLCKTPNGAYIALARTTGPQLKAQLRLNQTAMPRSA